MTVTSKYPSFNVSTGPVMPTGLDLQSLAAQADSHPEIAPADGQVYGMQDGDWVVLVPGQGGVGPIGPQGPIGPSGPQGDTGPAGPAGPKGDTGDPGATGLQGESGAPGALGPIGPAGPQGAAGPTGVAGPPGPTGQDGAIGLTGPAGPQGPAGTVGPIGPQGPAGAQGLTGNQGLAGPQGPAGPIGQQGPQGLPGATGSTGTAGLQGPAGPIGPAGPSTVSANTGNTATLGGDGFIFVPVPSGIPAASTTVPAQDGAGSAGVSTVYSRGDHQHPSDPSRLALTGGTMTGPLVLSGNPSVALGAATKQYVDAGIPGAATVVPLMDGTAAAGTGITWARADHVHPSDANKLAVNGGTMTGLLVLSGDPTAALGAATKQYSDTKVPLAGGTTTGVVNLLGTVAADNAPAGYVGEFLFKASAGPVSLTTGVPANIATLALTAGDWDVTGQIILTYSAGASGMASAISPTSAVLPTSAQVLAGTGTANQLVGNYNAGTATIQAGMCRADLSASGSVFLVAQITGGGTVTAQGFIRARRVR